MLDVRAVLGVFWYAQNPPLAIEVLFARLKKHRRRDRGEGSGLSG